MEQAPSGAPILASWGRRFAAILIDNLLLVVPAAVGILLISLDNFNDGISPVAVVGLLILGLTLTVGHAAYFTILNGNERGQTYGKRALGIRVIDLREGGRIGYGRSFARWAVPFVINLIFGFFFLIDDLWPLWDSRNQALHDKFANSIVVRVQ